MKILAFDTSTEACSVALICDDNSHHDFCIAPRKHTELILPMIDRVLSQGNCLLSQLDAIAFTMGPGSFTGIRIAAGVAKGLCFALEIPLIPVSTLAVLAQQAYRKYQSLKILPALDAKMNQIYWGGYHIVEGVAQPAFSEQVVNPDKATIPEEITWSGIGSGWKTYLQRLECRLQNKLLEIHSDDFPDALDILPMAVHQFKNKKFCKAEEAVPVYLRDQVT